MKVFIVGCNGQLGWELQRTCPPHVTLAAQDYPECDITDPDRLAAALSGFGPDWVINAAAYTRVDAAESEPDLALRVNGTGVANLARVTREMGARLVHISTDFVFSGRHFRPYLPDDAPDPRSVYGRTKLAGEHAIRDGAADTALVIRTAWLYSAHGNNFVRTMVDLMATRSELRVIADQIGTPTWANGLAWAIWTAMDRKLAGMYHWTDAGVASWYDFAVAIQDQALALGLLSREIPVIPIPASNYPTPAERPFYGVLDKHTFWEATGIAPRHWRHQLARMMTEWQG